MTFSFHPEAEQELIQSIDFYEDREKGLGQDFAFEVYSTVERILTYQQLGRLLKMISDDH